MSEGTVVLGSGPTVEGDEAPEAALTKVVTAAGALVLRRAAMMMVGALSTGVVTRTLGPAEYGRFGSVQAVWALAQTLAEFGFVLVLTREFGRREDDRGALLRAAYGIQGRWALGVGVLFLFVGALLIRDGDFPAYLVLFPSIVGVAWSGARALLMATYQVRRLAMIDVLTTTGQSVALAAVALGGGGPVGMCAVLSVSSLANSMILARSARTVSRCTGCSAAERRALCRAALPVGVSTVLSKVYVNIDIVLLSSLAVGAVVGDYVGVSKLLALAATVPGIACAAALPLLARSADDPVRREVLARDVSRLLSAVALPVYGAMLFFPSTFLSIALGRGFDEAAPMLVPMALAGVVGVYGNIAGTLLVALAYTRVMMIQNVLAVVLNITLNLLLIPPVGGVACAWVTLLTELVVCSASLATLARKFRLTLPYSGIAGIASLLVSCAFGVRVCWGDSPVGMAVFVLCCGVALLVAAIRMKAAVAAGKRW